jgi:ssDNA-binding replication factor A large subunit
MKISDLKANSNFDELVLKIVEKKEPREVIRRYGGTAKVCDLEGEDEEGNRIQITLWNDEIDMINADETLKISDGWVKEWNNQLQVSTGRNGKLEKIEK